MKCFILFSLCFFLFLSTSIAQNKKSEANNAGVFVDRQGVLRWKQNNKEAAFFGVNYTVPFAYGYRSIKRLDIEPEKAIQQDVYHMARLGLDAFRVHVWDTEITDSAGNLLDNEHLLLFDFLLAELKKRHIKILITPLAFWGNGYPEKDEKTGSFSSKYNKQQVLVTEAAIKAQENYLQQFLKHINPYTRYTYANDPDVIALEINNEPHHSGTLQQASDYISRMVKAVKSTGWSKPVFYNISESPAFANAVANADIDGVSFQWYPTGLVANRTLKGNYLPNVDRYIIPFDTIPQYRNKAKMVYEFDAGDVLQSNMYPAMARSFRAAGFQWATQFAYDPMATAYGNTEYQTHYLNLAYTPSKAISILIAAKAFHQLPRLRTYGTYPADSVFDVFRVSYSAALSEMNTAEEFYYSNTTQTKPVDSKKLQHIAGVGSSPVVSYEGYGSYFLDRLETGVWRLEVMPDAIHIRDPFEKASPQKEVTHIQWKTQPMRILLPDLGSGFSIKGLNEENTVSFTTNSESFSIAPGTYLLVRKGKETKKWTANTVNGSMKLGEFVAPNPVNKVLFVVHEPFPEVSAGKPFTIKAKIVGLDSVSKATLLINQFWGSSQSIPMKSVTAYNYEAVVPADLVNPGLLQYRILLQIGANDYFVFPGNYKGNPFAWDYYHKENWETFVAAEKGPLELFSAAKDRNQLTFYYPDWRNNKVQFVPSAMPNQLALKMTGKSRNKDQLMGWQIYVSDKIKGRQTEVFEKLVVFARSGSSEPDELKITLILQDASAYSTTVKIEREYENIEVPLSSFQQDSVLLLPRPYPGFLPLWFQPGVYSVFNANKLEKIQISFGQNAKPSGEANSVVIEGVWLK
jgi:hypothetical protein